MKWKEIDGDEPRLEEVKVEYEFPYAYWMKIVWDIVDK